MFEQGYPHSVFLFSKPFQTALCGGRVSYTAVSLRQRSCCMRTMSSQQHGHKCLCDLIASAVAPARPKPCIVAESHHLNPTQLNTYPERPGAAQPHLPCVSCTLTVLPWTAALSAVLRQRFYRRRCCLHTISLHTALHASSITNAARLHEQPDCLVQPLAFSFLEWLLWPSRPHFWSGH